MLVQAGAMGPHPPRTARAITVMRDLDMSILLIGSGVGLRGRLSITPGRARLKHGAGPGSRARSDIPMPDLAGEQIARYHALDRQAGRDADGRRTRPVGPSWVQLGGVPNWTSCHNL